ncbi:hypothetical protein Tco_0803496 [Tanacetum coccineum]|uniref:Uncharacterized protein n=1 Tax=Tanacetum coccineum TaxID=301880 RepID=A0ABQ5A658_9ASTR
MIYKDNHSSKQLEGELQRLREPRGITRSVGRKERRARSVRNSCRDALREGVRGGTREMDTGAWGVLCP